MDKLLTRIFLFIFLLGISSVHVNGQCYNETSAFAGVNGIWGVTGFTGGGGVSFADFNEDGFDDLSFTTTSGLDLLFYENNGDGTFALVDPPFVSNTDETKTILWIDYDNDGDKDMFVTAFEAPNRLYQNDGSLNFTDVTLSVGLPLDNATTIGANFGDIDLDGVLDLYITNYGPGGIADTNTMYQNIGGTFVDVTSITGTADYCDPATGGATCDSSPGRQSFCSTFFDYDLDGDQDFYVSNDRAEFANSLFQNNGDGTFTDVAQSTHSNVQIFSMNSGVGDSNGDGFYDLYSTNIGPSAHMVYNPGLSAYQEVAGSVGTIFNRIGWGANFFDYDNDNDEDLYVCAQNLAFQEPNALFVNDGTGNYTEPYLNSGGLGGIDHVLSHCNAIGDYDNDGNLDIVVTHFGNTNFFLFNSCESNSNNYIKFKLEGSLGNRDAYGAMVEVYTPSKFQRKQKVSHNAYLVQNTEILHFGLGIETVIDSVVIRWPFPDSDTTLLANDVMINAVNTVIEIGNTGCPDQGLACDDGDPCTTGETFDANCDCLGGTFADQDSDGICDAEDMCPDNPDPDCIDFPTVDPNLNIIRKWNEILLESIRLDLARPTVHARNLFHTSIAMWDAYAVYHGDACQYLLGNTVDGFTSSFDGFSYTGSVEENLESTISYACYRLLSHRFASSPNAEQLQDAYDYLMSELGYDIAITSTDYGAGNPAHLGNYIAEQLIDFGLQDGSNEIAGYENDYYLPVNDPLIIDLPGNPDITEYNRWQPLTLETYIDQSGNVIPVETPDFLSPEWGQVSDFALEEQDLTSYFRDGFEYKVYHDPGEPPHMHLDGSGDSDLFQWAFTLVSKWSSHLDPTDGVMIDISPATQGNLGVIPQSFDDYDDFYLDEGGTPSNGYPVNPSTGLPYPSNMVPRGDFARVLAEFWADGPDSETPPGHWFTLLNYVSDHPELEKKFEGTGPLLEDTEWYVKSYFAMGGAMHDAAVSAWGAKGWYDYIRPVSAIRAMADLGQSSDSSLPNYHAAGIPLTDGLVELVLAGDPLVGANDEHLHKIKVFAWLGHDAIGDEEVDEAGVGWILAENWVPYQRASFVTPPFAGYVSGHSTFSRAAAEVLTMLTGDEYFPGGIGTFLAEKDEFLVFEDGPSIDVELQWATYRDAAEQSALSRIWGGIHPPFDDIPGREIGLVVGTNAFNKAKTFFDNLDSDGDGYCGLNDPDDNDPCIPNTSNLACMYSDCDTKLDCNFDGGWQGWIDGGSDARRSLNDAAYAYSGNRCVRLRDNSSSSVITSPVIALGATLEVALSFTYIAESMDDSTEGFVFEVSLDGGTTFDVFNTWNLNDEFVNGEREFVTVTIPGPFSETTVFRFRCDASTNNDFVYLDDVVIRSCGFGAGCTEFDNNNFDLGWGIWIDPGSDARRSANDAAYAYSGNRCVRLRDFSTTSMIYTEQLNLEGIEMATVDFTYIASSLEDNIDGFLLEVSTNGGATYDFVEEWNLNDEFINELREFVSVDVQGPLSDETVFRIRSVLGDNNDFIYIDDVVITVCGSETLISEQATPRVKFDELDFEFYPNPNIRNNSLQLTISSDVEEVALKLIDMFGVELISRKIGHHEFSKYELDTSALSAGTYLIRMESENGSKMKKLIIVN